MSRQSRLVVYYCSFVLFAPLVSFAVTPDSAKFTENDEGSGKCTISINYKKGTVKSRYLNVSDVKWLMSQPGGVAMFSDISPKLTKSWLEKLVATNPPTKQVAFQSNDGSKGCRALGEMAKRLNQRAKDKKWDEESTQDLLVGGMQRAKFPPFESETPAGGVGASGGSTPAGATR